MRVVDRSTVEELMRSADPDAALVFRRGRCQVLPGVQAAGPACGLIVARRRDLARHLSGDPITDDLLDLLTCCLDNAVRDLGG